MTRLTMSNGGCVIVKPLAILTATAPHISHITSSKTNGYYSPTSAFKKRTMSRDRDRDIDSGEAHHHNHRNPDDGDDVIEVREIHALSSPQPPSSAFGPRGRESWEVSRSSSLSIAGSEAENFTTMSREFNALVVAGSTLPTSDHGSSNGTAAGSLGDETMANPSNNLGRIGEDELLEETNPLAIVPDSNPIPSPRRAAAGSSFGDFAGSSSSSVDRNNTSGGGGGALGEVSVHRVKREEVETKIAAWQTAEIAKINNRFKREDVIINGWESEQIDKSTAWLKKIERKLDERRARAVEKMQNEVAKARRKAEEKRASAEAKRGTKVAKVLELSSMLRAVGRAPSKRSLF